MNFIDKLDRAAKKNNSLLCIGLDIDLKKIPQSFLNKPDPIFEFNKGIIDSTKDLVCAYKPNIAFYEMYGNYGLDSLKKTIEYAGEDIPFILDAKRGDIGNTAMAYAKALFDIYKADAVTLNPYMGFDSIEPFLTYKDKGLFILCLTSNPSAKDFQTEGTDPLYLQVAKKVKIWNNYGNCGLVVGATKSDDLKEIRSIAGDMPILIPGVGAQGGDLQSSVRFGVTKKGERAIVNSSRGIIYASSGEDFAGSAKVAARKLKEEINSYRFVG
jgi:orotidine-5'-phosphate decarboxylase